MRKPEVNKVEVDMVPLIDIISLLLMFLIIVGDTAASASNIQMKLPHASEARWDVKQENRIVVQLAKVENGYEAVVNNRKYGADNTLKDYLDRQVDFAVQKGWAKRNADSTVDIPVKLRVPEDCPMNEVEKVLGTLAALGLTQVQYAAQK